MVRQARRHTGEIGALEATTQTYISLHRLQLFARAVRSGRRRLKDYDEGARSELPAKAAKHAGAKEG
jgi:hypothetical protein